MTFSFRAVARLTAFLIALSATALSSDLIDVFGAPLPRQVLGMSWFGGLAVVAILILSPMNQHANRRLLGAWDAAYLTTLLLWMALAASRGELDNPGTLNAIIAWLPAWITSIAVRMHVRQFGPRDITPTFTGVVAVVAVAHLCCLLLLRAGVSLPLRPDELLGRNAISILVAVAACLLTLHDMRFRGLPSWWLVGLIGLGFVHAGLNEARTAELILVLGLCLQVARTAGLTDRWLVWSCGLLCAGMMVAIVGLAPLLEWLRGPDVFGAGESAASTVHRVAANSQLLRLLVLHPFTGVGWQEVFSARSGRYIGHTLYLIIPAAFGLVTFVPVLAAMAWRKLRHGAASVTFEQAMIAVLVVATASFVNDPLSWFGLVIPLSASLSLQGSVRVSDASRFERAPSFTSHDVVAHLRSRYLAGAVSAVLCFTVLAGWFLRRDRFVATADVEIASAGAIAASSADPDPTRSSGAIESSQDANEYLQNTVLRETPRLRTTCGISPVFERQALIVRCKGATSLDAIQALDRIVEPIMRRHAALLVTRGRELDVKAEIDRATLRQLDDRAQSLERGENPVHGPRGDFELLVLLNVQRAKLADTLQELEQARQRAHPTRLVNGTHVVERRPPWLPAAVMSLFAGLTVAFALAIGGAAGTARSSRT
jgi:hypothetical protein